MEKRSVCQRKQCYKSLKYYKTYEEAKKAVKKIPEICGARTYRNIRRCDEGLPSSPASYYKGKGWVNWDHFLDRHKNTV